MKAPEVLEAQVRVPRDVLFHELDGEAVLLEQRSGEYFGLNETGTRMWSLLVHHGRGAEVLEVLAEEYAVSRETAHRDLTDFIEQLRGKGLLELEGDVAAAAS